MGDMADYALACNVYATDEAGFDGFDRAEYDEEKGGTIARSKIIQCKYCRTKAVYWGSTDFGWRLFDSETNQMHRCPHFKGK